jgi:uncharacterized protein YjbI with pentapeptide repeats
MVRKAVKVIKSDSWEHFEQNYVRPKVREKLLQAEAYLLKHQDQLAEEWLQSFRKICLKIKLMQSKGDINRVGFIQYSMLRSSILERKPRYLINVYHKDWYFDPAQKECREDYYCGRIFRFLDQLEQELEEPRKRYLDQITPVDLEQVKLREADQFNQCIVHLAEYALNQGETVPEFTEIAKEEEIEVRVGEYYDTSEVVYKEDMRVKDPEEIREWLEDKLENRYVAAILKNLDLSGGDYRGIDLRRADLRGSNLSKSNMMECLLIKAKLQSSFLQEVNFTGASLHDTDFSGADLRDAIFFGADGAKGVAATYAAGIYSFTGVNFNGANLEGADLRYANLQGADFRGARLVKTDFHGANLRNAIFSKAAFQVVNFAENQGDKIIWVD